jgi:hypothetical protein
VLGALLGGLLSTLLGGLLGALLGGVLCALLAGWRHSRVAAAACARRRRRRRYADDLRALPGCSGLRLPQRLPHCVHN